MSSPESRPRGPKAEQSARTRAKLLSATIACLNDFGYDRTTTVLVVQRAGVARGSLLHQFPTKIDLMMGTLEHIRDMRRRAHEDGLNNIGFGPERLDRMIEILWGQLSSPSGIARLEILLASRGDKGLASRLAPIEAMLQGNHREAMWRYAQRLGITDRSVVDAMTQLYTASLRGLSVDALFPNSREHVLSAVALLKRTMTSVLRAAMPQAPAGPSTMPKT